MQRVQILFQAGKLCHGSQDVSATLSPHQSSGDLFQGERSFEGSICQHQHLLPVENTSCGPVVGTEKGELEQPAFVLKES